MHSTSAKRTSLLTFNFLRQRKNFTCPAFAFSFVFRRNFAPADGLPFQCNLAYFYYIFGRRRFSTFLFSVAHLPQKWPPCRCQRLTEVSHQKETERRQKIRFLCPNGRIWSGNAHLFVKLAWHCSTTRIGSLSKLVGLAVGFLSGSLNRFSACPPLSPMIHLVVISIGRPFLFLSKPQALHLLSAHQDWGGVAV